MTQKPAFHLLRPETQLESDLLRTPEFEEGMMWGVPRPGHPEGMVLLHVREVLDNIEAQDLSPIDRRDLRLVAIAHDTFKYQQEALSHQGRSIDHGHLASSFLTQWEVPSRVREIVQWHDEAYYSWRMYKMGMAEDSVVRLTRLVERIHPWWSFFERFFQADTLTGDKDPTPLDWVNKWLPQVGKCHQLIH
ncbi:MAG: hypothetical protein K9I85_11315 [Saprospiraceae bacterium]|nr:hypothetical protein [Saprospiraceae bacterium]